MSTPADFDPQVLRLFDQYVHGLIDRRGFLQAAARYATRGVTALALLEALNPRFAEARQIAEDDPRVRAIEIEFDSPLGYGKARGYLVRPAEAKVPLPAVLVVHENRGLNPHIEDVARRFAAAGFLALAPDALFPLGGYPGDEDRARELFRQLDQEKTREDFAAAARFLKGHANAGGRLGVVGFCWGGGITNRLAAKLPDVVDAAVPFYGGAAPPDEAPSIQAELLLHFAEHDERINAAWPAYEAALKAAGVRYEAHVYPGTQHGFHNDTTPRYAADAAHLAWQRTLSLLRRRLTGTT